MARAKQKKIRVLLADDHPVVREGIRSCLAAQRHIEVIGEAANGEQAVSLAQQLAPDVVLMDINMPRLSGLEATKLLRRSSPRIRVLILSVHNKRQFVLQIVRSGARGYVLKESPPEELVRAIETVARGEACFSPEVARFLLNDQVSGNGKPAATQPPGLLSWRERQVLARIARGLSNKEIAAQFNVAVRTVETHRENLMNKLNIHTAVGLTRYAIAKGLVDVEEPAA